MFVVILTVVRKILFWCLGAFNRICSHSQPLFCIVSMGLGLLFFGLYVLTGRHENPVLFGVLLTFCLLLEDYMNPILIGVCGTVVGLISIFRQCRRMMRERLGDKKQ